MYGAWGTVCRNGFDQAAANVACRELGYPSGGLVLSSSITFGRGTGPVWLDSVGCHGTEDTLSACTVEIGGGTSSCTHAQDVNIVCGKYTCSSKFCMLCNIIILDTGNEMNFDIRLVDGDVASEGRVEVFYGGQWGTICDDLFDANDASVICRQLGYSLGGVPASFRSFGEGATSQPIWLDDLACNGTESNITMCPNITESLGDHNCVHFEDVGVHCFGKLNIYFELPYHCCLISSRDNLWYKYC